jgi:alanine dehydrogenase
MRQLESTMLIGVPKEIKTDQYRVGLTPATAVELTARGRLNVPDGKITCRAVADALRLPYTQAAELLR